MGKRKEQTPKEESGAPSAPSHDEERLLFKRYRAQPTEENLQRIIDNYTNLVYHLAHKYVSERDTFDDLSQVGMVGLLQAVARFEPERGWRFTTFAYRYIRGEIQRHFRDKSWSLAVPRKLKERSLKVLALEALLALRLGAPPTPKQIAEEAKLSEEDVLEALELGTAYHPLQVMEEVVPTEASIAPSEAARSMAPMERDLFWEHVLSFLSEREAAVIRLRFWDGLPQREVATKLGTSQMNVSRIQRGALAKLRKILDSGQLDLA